MFPENGHTKSPVWSLSERNRFYEVILLLKALHPVPPREEDSGAVTSNSTVEERFKCFVNQVSKVLDNVPHGPTISATALLWHDGKVNYVFASNDRDRNGLEIAEAFLKEIIDYVGGTAVQDTRQPLDHAPVQWVFDSVVRFHWERVEQYRSTLSKYLTECSKLCAERGTLADTGQDISRVRKRN